jgi:hypothetical protein
MSKTKAVLFDLKDEIQFWGTQIKEHMFFINQGLVDPDMRDEAYTLHKKWHQAIHNSINLLPLIEETHEFQLFIQENLTNGNWIGWLSYSFIEHLNKELMYFKDKLVNQQYNLKEEIKFWLYHHESEIAASEKLLDPLEVNLAKESQKYVEHVKALKKDIPKLNKSYTLKDLTMETQEILNEYLNKTNTLKEGIENATILTNIPLALINHVIREGERAIFIFNMLQ